MSARAVTSNRLLFLVLWTCAQILGLFGVVALGNPLALAQGLPHERDSSPALEEIEESLIDEVIVRGERTRRQIRKELRAIEMQIYSQFNDLNNDDDYDIVCRRVTRVGSQIPRTSCKAKIYWDALSNLAQGEEPGVHPLRPMRDPAKHAAILRQKILDLAKSDTSFLESLIKRRQLEKEEQALTKATD